jgi:hypothetical protein
MTETVKFDRDSISKMLKENICEVTFTKVNGEVRVMPCTLKADVIPTAPVHETNTDNPVDFPKVKAPNPAVVSAYCLDKKEWRSFRVENVLDVKVIE